MAELPLDSRSWTSELLLGVFQTHWHVGFPHSHVLAAAGREAEVMGAWLAAEEDSKEKL